MKLYAPILVAMLALPAFAQTDSTENNSTEAEDTLSLRTGTAFYTDETNMTLRSSEELQTNWGTMSAEDQAAVRAKCDTLPTPATELQPSKGTGDAAGDAATEGGDAATGDDSSGTTTAEDMGYMEDPVRMQAVCDAIKDL